LGARFSSLVHIGFGVHSACCTMATGYFPRAKRQGRGIDNPTPFKDKVKERVQPYISSPSETSWPVA